MQCHFLFLNHTQGFGDFPETKWLIYQGRFRFQNKIYFNPSDCIWARPGNKFSIDCIPFTFYPKLYVLFNKGSNVVSSLNSSQSPQNLNLFPNIWFNRTLTKQHFAPIYPLVQQMTGLMLYSDDINLLTHMQTKNNVNKRKMKEYLQLNNKLNIGINNTNGFEKSMHSSNWQMNLNNNNNLIEFGNRFENENENENENSEILIDRNDNFLPLHTFIVTFYSLQNLDNFRKSKYFTNYNLLMNDNNINNNNNDNFEEIKENLINGCFIKTSKIKPKIRKRIEKSLKLKQKQLTQQEKILKNFEKMSQNMNENENENNNDNDHKDFENNSNELEQKEEEDDDEEDDDEAEEESVNIRRLKQQFTNIEKIEKINENVILNPNLNIESASVWDLSENNSKREIIETQFRIETYYPRALISYLKKFELNPIKCHRIGIGNLFLNENETKENEWRIMNSLEIQTLYGYKNKITQIRPNMDVETSQTWPDIEKKATLMY